MAADRVAPSHSWQVIREVWNAGECLTDSTIQNVGISEQEAAALARELNDLEEIAPSYEGGSHRVYYIPQMVLTPEEEKAWRENLEKTAISDMQREDGWTA